MSAKSHHRRTLVLPDNRPPTVYVFSAETCDRLDALARTNRWSLSEALTACVEKRFASLRTAKLRRLVGKAIAERTKTGSTELELQAALLNFVNNVGQAHLFLPLYEEKWESFVLANDSPAEEPLRLAFREQLECLRRGDTPRIPTRIQWWANDFSTLSAERAYIYGLVIRIFDDVLKAIARDRDLIGVRCCKGCGAYMLLERRRGAPRAYCIEEHRHSNPGQFDRAEYMRAYRAALRHGAVPRGDRRKK